MSGERCVICKSTNRLRFVAGKFYCENCRIFLGPKYYDEFCESLCADTNELMRPKTQLLEEFFVLKKNKQVLELLKIFIAELNENYGWMMLQIRRYSNETKEMKS